MKVQFNRFTDMGCFTIRGDVGIKEWKILAMGFNTHFKDLEEMVVINLSHAVISKEVIADIVAFKKVVINLTQQKVFVISPDKNIGDFPKFDILLTRFQGQKIRQICKRIALEDRVYELETAINNIQEQIKALGFDESSAKKEIQKNITIKTMNKTLEQLIKQFKEREKNLKAEPCEIEDFDIKLKTAIDDLGKATNKPVTL